MTAYLGFVSAGFRFLVDISVVQEVFNASATPVKLDTVLVGEGYEIYWRGMLAKMIHFSEVLGRENSLDSDCYIICKPSTVSASLIVLKVDDVTQLHDIDEIDVGSIAVECERLGVMTNRIYLHPETGETAFILNDLQKISVFSENLMQKKHFINQSF